MENVQRDILWFISALIIIAIISVIVSQGSSTTALIQTAFSTLNRALKIVVSPIASPGQSA